MSGILSMLSTAVRGVIHGRSADAITVDKNTLINLIDNVLLSVAAVEAVDIPPAVQTSLKVQLRNEKVASVTKAYSLFVDKLGRGMSVDTLGAIQLVMPAFKSDLELIREDFRTIFANGTNEDTISIDQIRTTHAAVIGYIFNINKTAEWYVYLLSLLGNMDKEDKQPGYRSKFLMDNAEIVAETVIYISKRPKEKTILDDIRMIKEGGQDLFLLAHGSTLDNYVSDKDFSKAALGFFSGFNPFYIFLMVGDKIANHQRKVYERNKAMREWMLTKVAMLKLEQTKMPSDNSDYERLDKVCRSYSQRIAMLDQQIAEYEQ